MNMYAYVGNDPVNGVDPTGLIGGLGNLAGSCTQSAWFAGGVQQTPWEYDNPWCTSSLFGINIGIGSEVPPMPWGWGYDGSGSGSPNAPQSPSSPQSEPPKVNVDDSCKGLPAAYDPRVQQRAVDALNRSLSGNPQGTAEYGFWIAEPYIGDARWIGPTFSDGYRAGFDAERLARRRPGAVENVLTGYYPTPIFMHTHPNNDPPSAITPGVDDQYGTPVMAIDKAYNITCGGVK